MMSSTASSLRGATGISLTGALLNEVTIFITHILPLLLCCLVTAMLATTPKTHTIRLALCPVLVLLALRAAVPMDAEPRFHNNLAGWIFVVTVRTLDWGLARKTLVRQLRPANCPPSTLMDALDLIHNPRGYGWDWAHEVYIPPETRPSDRTRFVLSTILSASVHVVLFVIIHTAIRSSLSSGPVLDESLPFLHRAIRVCSFVGLGDAFAGSIFDESLPFYLRFLRSSIITVLGWAWLYTGLHAAYDLSTLPAVLFLGQEPSLWPPPFEAPWSASSVSEFWSHRWHQWLRQMLLFLGGRPLAFLIGRDGRTIGAFLASGIFHHIGLIVLNSDSELWRMLVGFGMMALAIIMERKFKYATQKKVQGLAGRVWTMIWIVGLGNVIFDGFTRGGLFGFPTWLDLLPTARTWVEHVVTSFDAFLHVMCAEP